MAENINVADAGTVSPISSGDLLSPAAEKDAASRVRATLETERAGSNEPSGPAKLLNEPRLPSLKRQNRARLQMQSPSRLYFYWSLAADPFQRLRRLFGADAGSYLLVAKLISDSDGSEEIYPIEAEGNWWFQVRAGRTYRAEVGFYAPNRPYFRILFSNPVEVPRSGPSWRAANDSDWMISSEKFAEVLDLSGYEADAYAVAAGETAGRIERTPELRSVVSGIVGDQTRVEQFSDEELHAALLAVASGVPIEALRWVISAKLFAFLQDTIEEIFSSEARFALREFFELDDVEGEAEMSEGAVFGMSRVNFPKRRRKYSRRFPFGVRPVGSHSFPAEIASA